MTDTPGQNRPVTSLADARAARKIAEQYAENLVTFRHALDSPNPAVGSDEWIQDMNSIEAADAEAVKVWLQRFIQLSNKYLKNDSKTRFRELLSRYKLPEGYNGDLWYSYIRGLIDDPNENYSTYFELSPDQLNKILDRYEDNEAIETLYAKSAVISALLTGQKKSKVELIAFQNLPVAMQLGVVRGLFDIYLNIEIKKLTKDREELPKIGPGLSGLDGIETATAIPGGSDLGAKDNFPGLRLVLPPQ
ncbi:MAG: hypothetical protein WAU72_02845 [Acidimicrobiia bacterium]